MLPGHFGIHCGTHATVASISIDFDRFGMGHFAVGKQTTVHCHGSEPCCGTVPECRTANSWCKENYRKVKDTGNRRVVLWVAQAAHDTFSNQNATTSVRLWCVITMSHTRPFWHIHGRWRCNVWTSPVTTPVHLYLPVLLCPLWQQCCRLQCLTNLTPQNPQFESQFTPVAKWGKLATWSNLQCLKQFWQIGLNSGINIPCARAPRHAIWFIHIYPFDLYLLCIYIYRYICIYVPPLHILTTLLPGIGLLLVTWTGILIY